MPLSDAELKSLTEKTHQIRKDMLDVVGWAGGGHIGGALSCAEILVLLYYKYLRIDPKRPDWEERDRFVLSKGHAGLGHAAILADKGYFDREELKTFNHNFSAFGMHLNGHTVKGVDVSTGSLGHGLPIGVGLAIGARLRQKSWLTYCVLGDGECNEGSVWEAAMAAAHYKVTNLVTFVDRNKLMLDGPTEEVMALEPFAKKWEAFGFRALEVDGHSFPALAEAIETAQAEKSRPTVIIAKTTKGKGVDFMENQVAWHYGGLDSDMLAKAKASVDRMYGKA
jgi:transketolase